MYELVSTSGSRLLYRSYSVTSSVTCLESGIYTFTWFLGAEGKKESPTPSLSSSKKAPSYGFL